MATLKQFKKLGKLERAARNEKDPKKAEELREALEKDRAKLQKK